MEAGASEATAATSAQVKGSAGYRSPTYLLANLLVDPVAIRWIVTHVLGKGDTGSSCYVDSVASVELLDRECGRAGTAGPLDVLLEVGYLGGRTGVRSFEESLGVAQAVNQSEHLCLIGVAGCEGLMPGGSDWRARRL
jgi:D-serine dehydratase